MRLNKHIGVCWLLLAATVMAMTSACSSSKKLSGDTVSYSAKSSILASLGIRYEDWQTAEISGKLKMKGLPLSPSVKIYMKRGEELILSARAPLVGEAVRIELATDSLLIVNKLNNTYCLESADKLQEVYPSLCGELQSLLLGRVVIPGHGELSEANVLMAKIESLIDGTKKISPNLDGIPVEADLDYLISAAGKMRSLAVGIDGKKVFSLDYEWKANDGCDMKATVYKKKPTVVELNLDAPKFGIAMPDPYKVNTRKFQRRPLKEMLKNINI